MTVMLLMEIIQSCDNFLILSFLFLFLFLFILLFLLAAGRWAEPAQQHAYYSGLNVTDYMSFFGAFLDHFWVPFGGALSSENTRKTKGFGSFSALRGSILGSIFGSLLGSLSGSPHFRN